MGVCVGDLDTRQVERLRAELVESLAANFAYPPFFDYGRRQARMRPLDQAKRDEVVEFVRSANLAQVERVDVGSPELRRYLERLFARYLEVNPSLAPPRLHRRQPELRARVPRVAAEVQRGLAGFVAGSAQDFGTRRPQLSWRGSAASTAGTGGEHNTRVLEAVLVRGRSGELVAPAAAPRRASEQRADVSHPGSPGALSSSSSSSPSWVAAAGASDLTVPVPSQGVQGNSYTPPPTTSPFAGLEIGSQSTAFAHLSGVSDMPTGPLVAVRPDGVVANGHAASGSEQDLGKSGPRELPPELYKLYGEYLRDMQPEAPASNLPPVTEDADGMDGPTVALPAAPSAPSAPMASAAFAPAAPAAAVTDDYAISRPHVSMPAVHAVQPVQAIPAVPAVQAPAALPTPADTRSDQLVFWQLRYQLEAYVRRAARSYGVGDKSGDPAGVLDALRRSRFVDDADLRIAEGILALTDRVTRTGAASLEDYRQALTLYLLYHRSHLSE